jgi:hypothetical protein
MTARSPTAESAAKVTGSPVAAPAARAATAGRAATRAWVAMAATAESSPSNTRSTRRPALRSGEPTAAPPARPESRALAETAARAGKAGRAVPCPWARRAPTVPTARGEPLAAIRRFRSGSKTASRYNCSRPRANLGRSRSLRSDPPSACPPSGLAGRRTRLGTQTVPRSERVRVDLMTAHLNPADQVSELRTALARLTDQDARRTSPVCVCRCRTRRPAGLRGWPLTPSLSSSSNASVSYSPLTSSPKVVLMAASPNGSTRWRWPPTTGSSACNWPTSPPTRVSPRPPVTATKPDHPQRTDAKAD